MSKKKQALVPVNILALGGGVQSSTIAIMAAKGVITPMPDAAIFADTHGEPEVVYRWLDYLKDQLPYPLLTTSAGSLEENELTMRISAKTGLKNLRSTIPAFVLKENGSVGLLGRKCTRDFKIRPIHRAARKFMKSMGRKRINIWIGISTDEAHRMKPSRLKYISNSWPLIDMGMSRSDCLKWMSENGYPTPPRSACRFCPFHGDEEWRNLKSNHPEDFAKAVAFEKNLQATYKDQEVMKGVPFLHRTCSSLNTVDFTQRPGHQQIALFGNECEGLCGV